MKKFILVLSVLALLVSPVLGIVNAQRIGDIDPAEDAPSIQGLTGFFELLQIVINFLFWFLMALTVIFVIYAAYLFLTAAGDDSKVGKARQVILYAIVAVVVAVLAQGLYLIVLNALQAAD